MRVDQDEIRIGQNWRNPAIGRMEWLMIIALAVMVGGLLHDGARLLIARAYTEQALKQLEASTAKLSQQLKTQQAVDEQARIRAREVATKERRLSSDECRFWAGQHGLNPTDRTKRYMYEFCGY